MIERKTDTGGKIDKSVHDKALQVTIDTLENYPKITFEHECSQHALMQLDIYLQEFLDKFGGYLKIQTLLDQGIIKLDTSQIYESSFEKHNRMTLDQDGSGLTIRQGFQ